MCTLGSGRSRRQGGSHTLEPELSTMPRACPVCGVSVRGAVRISLAVRRGEPATEIAVCSTWCGRILTANPGGYTIATNDDDDARA